MEKSIDLKLAKLLPAVKRNILLKNHTTFRIGGPADFFYEAEKENDLIKAIKICRKLKIPFFVLGGGSNILFSDKGYRGMIIKVHSASGRTKFKVQSFVTGIKVVCGAGVFLAKLVSLSKDKGATGFEWAAGIPGTIGGAIRGNAGAFGGETSRTVKRVWALDAKTLKTKIFKNKDCQFSYRESFFKKNPAWVILRAEFCLERGEKKEITQKIDYYLRYRRQNHPLEFSSAGSVFKNPEVSNAKLKDFLKKFPKMKEKIKDNKIPAGFLIEKTGLKGKKIGQAMVSEKHQNFIVNLGGAKAADVKKLIKLIKEKVKKRFGLQLMEEIVIMPSEARQNDEPST